MDINVAASKYKEGILLAPLEAKMEQLSGEKQLALCLMSLERLYTTYFVKYDKKGAKNFAKVLDILEQALFAGEIPEPDIVEQLADWCDQCVDKMDDGRISEWKQCAIEILFPDCLCQFVESLAGICRQKIRLNLETFIKLVLTCVKCTNWTFCTPQKWISCHSMTF